MTFLQAAAQQAPSAPTVMTRIGEPNVTAMVFFFAFISITLGITYWAAAGPAPPSTSMRRGERSARAKMASPSRATT